MHIKETRELLQGLEKMAVVGVKVFKDGKIGISDLRYLKDLAIAFNDFKDAIDDIDMIDDEIMDLSVDEAKELWNDLGRMFKSISDARL